MAHSNTFGENQSKQDLRHHGPPGSHDTHTVALLLYHTVHSCSIFSTQIFVFDYIA